MGGQMSHTYNYDGLYRLTSANGTYTGASNTPSGGRGASYTLEMAYDNLHNIVSKKQHVQQKGIQFDGVLKAGYELAYNYASNPFQISTLEDENYRTEGTDVKDPTKKDHAYSYDANGNLVYVNTAREKKDSSQDPKSTERKLLWDEENRLEAIDDNGFVSNYWYDAAGERTVKTSGESQQMYVNSVFSGGDTQTANFTAYVNPYLVVSKGGSYTKHIYIGSQRIVSKLGDLDSYGSDPRRIEYAGANVDGAKVDYANKYTALQQTIKDRYDKFEVPYYGKDNDDYVNGQGFCCDDTPKTKSFAANDNPELFQYYYHSDHLGSSSLITNLDGEVVQHIEYVPFGEVFIEERNNTWNTPYLFNAKELDEETGLYYYGARYYDPRTSVWISTDPLQEKYPNISTYAYAAMNPVKYVDPDGRILIVAERYRQYVDKALSSIFGSLSSTSFEYDANGKLRFTGNLNDFTKKQQAVLKDFIKVLDSRETTSVIYEQSFTFTDNDNNSITVRASFSGGESTLLMKENPSFAQNYIILDERVQSRVPVNEVTSNYYKTKGGEVDPTGGANFVSRYIETNLENLFWHAIGHVLYAGKSQDKVLKFDNKTRELMNPPLPKRNPDETHNSTITSGTGSVWEQEGARPNINNNSNNNGLGF